LEVLPPLNVQFSMSQFATLVSIIAKKTSIVNYKQKKCFIWAKISKNGSLRIFFS